MAWKEPVTLVQPASYPVEFEDLQNHVRVDSDDDETYITDLLAASVIECEQMSGRKFIHRTFGLYLDYFPSCRYILLPYPPLLEVTTVTYTDESGTTETLDTDSYEVDAIREPGAIVLKRGYSWPSVTLKASNGVYIEYRAGYGEADQVPDTFKMAIRMLVAWRYRHRDPQAVPPGLDNLLNLDSRKHA